MEKLSVEKRRCWGSKPGN